MPRRDGSPAARTAGHGVDDQRHRRLHDAPAAPAELTAERHQRGERHRNFTDAASQSQ